MVFLFLFLAYAVALSVALAPAGFQSATHPQTTRSDKNFIRVLIIGATGGTGRQLLSRALERGYTVTALVRDPGTLSMEHPNLTVLRGDVMDSSSVDSAMRGQDAVLSSLGHKRFFGPTRILSGGTRNVLRAMETHGARRFICETSLGIGDSAGRMGLYYTLFVIPIILPWYFRDKARQERMIASSKLDWVIVRPAVLTNDKKRGKYRHGHNVGSFLWTARIARADVADFMLNQLADDSYVGTAVGICW